MSSEDPVHTIAELIDWPKEGKWLAVLGHPIAHSISPAMHNAALTCIQKIDTRFADWRYVRFDVPPPELPLALKRLLEAGFLGLNLTAPHKVLALTEVVHIDEAARPIGAVNTLKAGTQGWEGFNTDGQGMAAGILSDLGLSLKGATVVLLGAGGAARGAAVECLQQGVSALWIANRTQSNLETLLRDLSPLCPSSCVLKGFSPQTPPPELPKGAILINATSSGLKQGDALPIEIAALPRPSAVYDMIYNPPCTPLLQAAKELGIPCSNGLSMLVNQGAKALAHWTGLDSRQLAPAMDSAARQAMRQ